MATQQLLERVVVIANEAGKFLLELQPQVQLVNQNYKDFLTNADRKSHTLIKTRLQQLDSEILVASEEDIGGVGVFQGSRWVIDPVDGTYSYSQYQPMWGVSIALVENGRTELGVVTLPRFGRTIGVTREETGMIVENTALELRQDRKLTGAPVWIDWRGQAKGGQYDPKYEQITFDLLAKLRETTLYPAMHLCITYSLIAIATGQIAGYFHPGPGPEDIAAGCLIVEKAGGRITDFEGNPWTPFSKTILVSNGFLHDQLLGLLKGCNW